MEIFYPAVRHFAPQLAILLCGLFVVDYRSDSLKKTNSKRFWVEERDAWTRCCNMKEGGGAQEF